ncbi:MAG: mobilization protein, partial [Tannerella sp.]|nr:mobilization protein [Tannerella sp.]
SAKNLSERFGKVLQKRHSMTISRQDKSTSISTQLDSLIPASKISNLTQGMFVGAVSDNFDERIEQKIFHAEIVVDNERVARETKAYQKIPDILDFRNEQGEDIMQAEIERNYSQIKADVKQIVVNELKRIAEDPALRHLIRKE